MNSFSENITALGPVIVSKEVEIVAINNSQIIFMGDNYLFPHSRFMAEGQANTIVIGKRTRVQIRSMVMGDVVIGSDTIIAPDVFISSGTHLHDMEPNLPINEQDCLSSVLFGDYSDPVIIGSNVWIGRLTTVMPGRRIGNNSIVAANSVVTQDIPSNEIWGGIPCKKIASRNVTSNKTRLNFFHSKYYLS